MLNPSKHMYHVTLLTGGHFLSDFYCNFLPILLPFLIPQFGLSLTMSGLLVMVFSFAANALQPVFGYLVDKSSIPWLLLLTVPGAAFFICLTGYATNAFLLFLLIIFTGLAIAIFHPLGSTLTAKVAAPPKLGLSLSIYVAGGNIGFALAPLTLVYFTQAYGLKSLPVLILPALLLSLLYYHSRLHTVPTAAQQTTATSTLQLKALFNNASLIKLNLGMGLRAWTHVAVATYLPMLLISHGHDATFAGMVLTIFLVGAASGGLIGGYFSDKAGYKKVIVIALLLGIAPTYLFFSSESITPLTLIYLFFCGASLQAPQPSSLVWAQKLLPNYAGMASGMMMGLSFGLGGIGTAVTAALADFCGLSTALLLTTLPLALGAVIIMFTPPAAAEKSNRSPSHAIP